MRPQTRDVRVPESGESASDGWSGHILIRRDAARCRGPLKIQSTLRYRPLRTHGPSRSRTEFMDAARLPIQ
jgi:hypothetical protein